MSEQDTSIKKPPLQSIYPTAINDPPPTESIIKQPVVGTPKTNAKKNCPGWYSVASFLSALIPIALWAYCLIQYYTNTSSNVYGTDYARFIFILPIAYYCSVGLPIAGFSIGTGIRGLKSHLHRLASISLFLKLCTVLLILYFLLFK